MSDSLLKNDKKRSEKKATEKEKKETTAKDKEDKNLEKTKRKSRMTEDKEKTDNENKLVTTNSQNPEFTVSSARSGNSKTQEEIEDHLDQTKDDDRVSVQTPSSHDLYFEKNYHSHRQWNNSTSPWEEEGEEEDDYNNVDAGQNKREEEKDREDPLPRGWTREEDVSGNSYYWCMKDGRISFTRPKETAGDEEVREELTSAQRSEDESDQHQKPIIDEFGKLLRVQMFHRQLKEIMRLGRKELLRSVIVRFEETMNRTEAAEDEYDDDDDKETKKEFRAAKLLLKEIDFYNHELRWPVFSAYWLMERFSSGGKRPMRMEALRKAMAKYDDLNERNSHFQQKEDEDAAAEMLNQPPQPIAICSEIDTIIDSIIKRSLPPKKDQNKRKEGKTFGSKTGIDYSKSSKSFSSSSSYNTKTAFKGDGSHVTQKPNYESIRHGSKTWANDTATSSSSFHQYKDVVPKLSEEERAEIDLYQRVKHFLRQQMECAQQLAQRLRPRENQLPILAMDKKTMAEIRSYGSPKPIVHRVMQASLLLLGYDEATTALWANCKAACVPDGRNGLNRQLMKFNSSEVDEYILQRTFTILRQIRLEEIQKASPGAATFYVWALSVLKGRGFGFSDADAAVGSFDQRQPTAKWKKREIVRREQEILSNHRYKYPKGNAVYHQPNAVETDFHGTYYHP